jgi:murein DD-endopeptidase MepM/ murein hydrolase activator NlpD
MKLNTNRPEHDVYALDFLPVTSTGVPMTHMPVYAPFTGTIVYTGNDHNCILQSNNKVHTPSGLKYVRVLVAHNDNPPPVVTTEFRQGQQFYTTGNYGYSFGEHLHMEYAIVDNTSDRLWNTGGIGLYNGVHMWDALYIDDTYIAAGGSYNWLLYGETPPMETPKKKRFPWVLYARKFRNNRANV